MSDDPGDDVPELSKESFAALLEFVASETEAELSNSRPLKEDNLLKVNELIENWQLSQFWYDDETAVELSEEVCCHIPHSGKIALIGCPSLYYFIKKKVGVSAVVKLMDIDERFSAYKEDFQYYDYNTPLPPHVPEEWRNTFDMVILDPPFLSEECFSKCASTTKFLTDKRIIVCTGAVMETFVERMLAVRRTSFVPKHKCNLGNEFGCFVNYRSDRLTFV